MGSEMCIRDSVKIGEYEPDYGDTAEIAPCVVEVAKKDQRYIVNPL